ncbi:MAG: hypothetical protein GY754_03700 [bacterium]|nr:hypothetical protein [bacterium]
MAKKILLICMLFFVSILAAQKTGHSNKKFDPDCSDYEDTSAEYNFEIREDSQNRDIIISGYATNSYRGVSAAILELGNRVVLTLGNAGGSGQRFQVNLGDLLGKKKIIITNGERADSFTGIFRKKHFSLEKNCGTLTSFKDTTYKRKTKNYFVVYNYYLHHTRQKSYKLNYYEGNYFKSKGWKKITDPFLVKQYGAMRDEKYYGLYEVSSKKKALEDYFDLVYHKKSRLQLSNMNFSTSGIHPSGSSGLLFVKPAFLTKTIKTLHSMGYSVTRYDYCPGCHNEAANCNRVYFKYPIPRNYSKLKKRFVTYHLSVKKKNRTNPSSNNSYSNNSNKDRIKSVKNKLFKKGYLCCK